MVVSTPRLCNDPAFLPPQETHSHAIVCQPVIPEDEIEGWTEMVLEEQAQAASAAMSELEGGSTNADQHDAQAQPVQSPYPVVGGIRVGAKRLVGTEGKVIEKSVVVGGGKEFLLGTVASSDGSAMSPDELAALKLPDPDNIEQLKRNTKKLAGHNPWKVQLIQTPRGKELRGVIEESANGEAAQQPGDRRGDEHNAPTANEGDGAAIGHGRKNDEPDHQGEDAKARVKDEL